MSEWLRAIADDIPGAWRPITAILLSLIGAGLGRLLGHLLSNYAGRVGERVGTPLPRDRKLAISRWTFAALLTWSVRESFQILELPEKAALAATSITFGLGILFATLLCRQLVVLSLGWYAAEVATRTRQPVDTQFIPLIRKLAIVFMYATAAVILLRAYGYDISTLVVSLGVGSLALGLSMQQTLANMIAGFTIMLDRPFRIGDRVQLSTGEIGDVTEIGLRSTRVLVLDLSTVIIPNSQMVNERIVNRSYPDTRVRPTLEFGVAYGSDPAVVKQAIGDVLAAETLVLKQPAPAIRFCGLGESAMNVEVRFTVGHFGEEGDAVDAVLQGITRRFAEVKIVIPYPVRMIVPGGGFEEREPFARQAHGA